MLTDDANEISGMASLTGRDAITVSGAFEELVEHHGQLLQVLTSRASMHCYSRNADQIESTLEEAGGGLGASISDIDDTHPVFS